MAILRILIRKVQMLSPKKNPAIDEVYYTNKRNWRRIGTIYSVYLLVPRVNNHAVLYLRLDVDVCVKLNEDSHNVFLASQRCDVEGGISFLLTKTSKELLAGMD